MNTRGLIGALIGALVGAGIWGGISAATDYEVGFVAWLIGGLVGGGAKYMGAEGQRAAVICAGLALASIFVGKMIAVQMSIPGPDELRTIAQEEHFFTRELYAELVKDADDFAKLTSEAEYADFMASHDYSETSRPERISDEEIDYFKQESVPHLREFHADPPDFAQWKSEAIESFVEMAGSELPLTEIVIENLGVFDLIFAVLGLVTAYKIVLNEE